MNNQFEKLAQHSPRSTARAFLCLTLAVQCFAVARAGDFRSGPLINLSEPDPFAGCVSTLPSFFVGAQLEPCVVVNPKNANNLVAAWITEQWKGVAPAVSLDGGASWQSALVPNLTLCTGGTAQGGGGDPSLSFAPNGDLYFAGGLFTVGSYNAFVVSKSADGGLHWSAPVTLAESDGNHVLLDKESVTADPTDARFVYVTWTTLANGNRGPLMLARTTDGGRNWEPARMMYNPGTSDSALNSTLVILPNGTLLDFFNELLFSNDNGGRQKKETTLSMIRSNDKGQSWSAPSRLATLPIFTVTDPETGQLVVNPGSYPPFFGRVAVDPKNGNLYVVWEDTRFSGGQFSSIAFMMSADGGVTWSSPIPVNKTPTNIAPANRQAFMPTVAVAADGTIAVTYYDFRFNDANPGLPTDYWLVHCHPSARRPSTDPANWKSEIRLTDMSFNIETALNFGGLWIGDYQGLAAADSDFVAVWTQPHGTDPDSIFYRRVGP